VKISAVVPAYNEASRIGPVIRAIGPYVDEVVVVDDGSADETARIAAEAGAVVIRHERNQGYIFAQKTGFHAATGAVVVTIDADGEHDPAEIPLLAEPVVLGEADLVFGQRPEVARVSERLINWLVARRLGLVDTGTGFRAMRRDLAVELRINGLCTCGILALEAASRGARLAERPVSLLAIRKPRRIAWFHAAQLLLVLRWLVVGADKR
jgi:polyprenyl-phospho-N-acetylgalactosaminyl synthase